ncbi:MAG: DegT/DnrJ/EryC1/StrS aminotransferase family protein [Pyrinomonadaceae bacterium]|nr:DegT/DnrJ/EryC1/StrS aminotransferase family protein [Pyrinomonadaceae bacterium]
MSHQVEKPAALIIPHSKPCLGDEDLRAVASVLETGMIAEGALVREFEEAMSRYLGLRGGVAAPSGTSALFLALKALGVGAGDEVIIPTYTCRSVWDAVRATEASAVLCDITDDWCMSAETIRPHVSKQTKAIVLVHTFGIMAEVDEVCALGIPVIEDCCQSLGAKSGECIAGTKGDLCVLSFHATKLLTTGEGGMALANDEKLLRKLRALKQGEDGPLMLRYRQPLTDLQAALGLSQLGNYDNFLQRRHVIAEQYFIELEGLPVELPQAVKGRSIFFRFPLGVSGEFDAFRRRFDTEGIQVRRGVDSLLHRQCGLSDATFPNATRSFSRTLSIPLYPALSPVDCSRVVEVCRSVFEN